MVNFVSLVIIFCLHVDLRRSSSLKMSAVKLKKKKESYVYFPLIAHLHSDQPASLKVLKSHIWTMVTILDIEAMEDEEEELGWEKEYEPIQWYSHNFVTKYLPTSWLISEDHFQGCCKPYWPKIYVYLQRKFDHLIRHWLVARKIGECCLVNKIICKRYNSLKLLTFTMKSLIKREDISFNTIY